VRKDTACEWMEGEESDEDTEVEDLDDQLFRLIESTPRPHTVSRVLRMAVVQCPLYVPWYLRSKISTIMTTMRRTAQNIFTRSVRNAPAINSSTSLLVPLDINVVVYRHVQLDRKAPVERYTNDSSALMSAI